MHTVEISENEADVLAEEISKALESEHNWYADFKNETTHFIIFRNKVFKVDRISKEQYVFKLAKKMIIFINGPINSGRYPKNQTPFLRV